MNTIVIQARMDSTRLPGKVLKDILGKPMLAWIIERVKQAKTIDRIILATTKNPNDTLILELAKEYGVIGFAGSEDDVLDRYYQAASHVGGDTIVRVTGDCPLIDPDVIDEVVDYFLANNFDYVSNIHPPTYPDGLDVEVFSFAVLKESWHKAQLKSEREHVTSYIWENANLFNLDNVSGEADLSHLGFTVDTKSDLDFVREIYARLETKGVTLRLPEIIQLLEQEPTLLEINQEHKRNESYWRS